MADPLSVTSGIVTLLTAGGAIGNVLKKIVRLTQAPEIFLALNNEIADLQYLVATIDELLQQQSDITNKAPYSNRLCVALEKVKHTLLNLERLVSYELTVIESSDGNLRLDKSVWLRVEPKIRALKDQVRDDKAELRTQLAIMTHSNSLEGLKQSQRLFISAEEFKEQIFQTLSHMFSEQSRKLEKDMVRVLDQDHAQGQDLGNVKRRLSRSDNSTTAPDTVSDTTILVTTTPTATEASIRDHDEPRLLSRANHKSISLLSPSNRPQSLTMSLRLTQSPCESDCGCSCHRQSRLRSPNFLNNVLGSLFVGYQVSPWAAQPCPNPVCRRRSRKFTYTYAFPNWFCNRVLSVKLSYSYPKGPEMCLKVMRVRPMSAEIFAVFTYQKYAKNHLDNVSTVLPRVKGMLDNGQASVLDVHSHGQSPLYVAITFGHWEVVRLLLSYGADPHLEDNIGSTPFKIAWSGALGSHSSLEATALVQELFWDYSGLEVFEFPQLHRAYLGISGVTFDMVFSSLPMANIDATDAMGRTILSWASQKGDDSVVAQLLARGADPNLPDLEARSPLIHSALTSSTKCMKLLLSAGANVESKDRYGGTALTIAAAQCTTDCVKLLITSGADIESRDRAGGRALHSAAVHKSQENVLYLLQKGAAIDARDESGGSVLEHAIYNNACDVVKVLLGFDSDGPRAYIGSRIFFLLARHGSRKMLKIVSSAALVDVDLKVTHELDRCAPQLAKWRRDHNHQWSRELLLPPDPDPIAWFNDFQALWDIVASRQQQASYKGFNDRETIGASLADDAGSAEGGLDDHEEQELWEDAPESPSSAPV